MDRWAINFTFSYVCKIFYTCMHARELEKIIFTKEEDKRYLLERE